MLLHFFFFVEMGKKQWKSVMKEKSETEKGVFLKQSQEVYLLLIILLTLSVCVSIHNDYMSAHSS